MLCRATQHGWVMVESCNKNVVHWRREWQTLQYSCLKNPINSMKKQKDTTLVDEPPKSECVQYATGQKQRNSSRKRAGQNRNDAQLWMCLVVKVWCCKQQYCTETWNVRS